MRLAVLLALASLLLAGCAAPEPPLEASAAAPTPARPPRMDWSAGNWWAYHAVVGDTELDVAVVLHEVRADGYRVGSNLSVGFFGLPWDGALTPSRSPILGDEVWPLFQFPLADGQQWSYHLLGHDATTSVRAMPDGRFEMEASAWGATFARYDYSPDAGWFTHLELIEPTDGSIVLAAALTGYGERYDEDYFIERTLRVLEVEYPTLPGAQQVRIPSGAVEIHTTLKAVADAGALTARLRSSTGETLAEASSIAGGVSIDRASVRVSGPVTWTLEHLGGGVGTARLEIAGVFPAR